MARRKEGCSGSLDGLAVEADSVTVPDSVLASCAARTAPATVRFENGTLYYRREGRPDQSDTAWGEPVHGRDAGLLPDADSGGQLGERCTELVRQYDNGGTTPAAQQTLR